MNPRNVFSCLLISLLLASTTAFSQPPYPIIFVHGLTGSDKTFETTMRYLGGYESSIEWSDLINVYDIALNADNDNSSAILGDDVAWQDFVFEGDQIRLGRRLWSPEYGANEHGEYLHEWGAGCFVFAVNFQEERIEGADHIDDHFDFSNSAAIYKQGYALKILIQEVLSFMNAEKVVLVGHSMGGLAIREYLQRIENSARKWWVDSLDTENGHKVAKVVTIGTPHLGSNTASFAREGFPPNINTEAIRDLRYGYNPLSWSPDTFLDIGVYLFGGTEQFVQQNGLGYHNYDINCDGDALDAIVGLNDGSVNGEFNPSLPLPSNIDYTWIVSTQPPGDGDLVVRADRQWLYNIGDTLHTDRAHWNEGEDYSSIIRGLDEPDSPELAYEITSSGEIEGLVSTQPDNGFVDPDYYTFTVSNYTEQLITVTGPSSGIDNIVLLDENLNELANDVSIPLEMNLNLVPGEYYLRVEGWATGTTWEHPYTVTLTTTPITFYADFSATPTTGTAPLTVQFTDESVGNVTTWEWELDDDGNIDSFEENPQFTYTEPGVYTVTHTVTDGTFSDTETKFAYIEVGAAAPQVVTDLTIQSIDSGRIQLDWSPVTEDIIGNPISDVYYKIFAGPTSDFAATSQSIHSIVGYNSLGTYIYEDRQFFSVEAVIDNEFIIQPGHGAGKDVWTTSVYSWAPGGGGPGGGLDNEELRVGGWADYYYSLIEFDLLGAPANASSATLFLYSFRLQNQGAAVPMYFDRITEAWDWDRTDRLWWADRPTYSQWFPNSIPAPARESWYSIDITELYNSWMNGTHQNYGVQLRPTSVNNRSNTFYSSDYLEDPALRPYLQIVP